MMFPTLEILGKIVPVYGLLCVIGLLLGGGVAALRCPRFGLSREDCIYFFVFGCIGAMVGAKLLYLATVFPDLCKELPLLFQQPEVFLQKYLYGGMVFYGGLAGAIIVAILYARWQGMRLVPYFPVLIPALPLIHAVGRLGCFSVGCCYGRPSSWGIAFTHSPVAPNGVPLLPVQLWECGAELAIFFFMLWFTARPRQPAKILMAYLLCYAPVRFVLEFFRYDAYRGVIGPFSLSQWLSLGVIAVCGVLLVRGKMNKNREYSI